AREPHDRSIPYGGRLDPDDLGRAREAIDDRLRLFGRRDEIDRIDGLEPPPKISGKLDLELAQVTDETLALLERVEHPEAPRALQISLDRLPDLQLSLRPEAFQRADPGGIDRGAQLLETLDPELFVKRPHAR